MKRTQKDEKLRRIRARSSYLLFRKLYDFLNKKPSVADILRKIHDVLDGKRAFGSERNAGCAVESLEWVLGDNRADDTYSQPDEKHKKPCTFVCMGDGNGNNT